MIGNIAADFLTTEIVWVRLARRVGEDEVWEAWGGKILDVQDYGLMVKVLCISVNGRITDYVESDTVEVRFLPWHRLDYVTVREES